MKKYRFLKTSQKNQTIWNCLNNLEKNYCFFHNERFFEQTLKERQIFFLLTERFNWTNNFTEQTIVQIVQWDGNERNGKLMIILKTNHFFEQLKKTKWVVNERTKWKITNAPISNPCESGMQVVTWNFFNSPFNEYLENGEKPTIGDIGAGVGQLGAWLKSQVKPSSLKWLFTFFRRKNTKI